MDLLEWKTEGFYSKGIPWLLICWSIGGRHLIKGIAEKSVVAISYQEHSVSSLACLIFIEP